MSRLILTHMSYLDQCVFPQIKVIKHIERDFHSVAWVEHGVLGVTYSSVGICDGAPSTVLVILNKRYT